MLTKTQKSNIKPLRWQRNQYSAMSRQIDVLQATISFMVMIWWDNLWGNYTAEVKRQRAKWLVRNMLELGPTFIKIGQSLSTRSDLLPKEYIEELATLQDQVPAFATEEAIAIIESELGKPVDILFKNFDPVPLAAASLGQVHRATLYSGEAVVVKVQRPGLKKLFDLDIKVLKRIIHFCQKRFAWAKTYDLEAIYYEFFHILFQEIDYIQEGENADRFRENFKDLPEVIVPKVYWQYCTQKVLVLEYLPGIKINQREAIIARNISPQRLNQIGVCCYLK
ncbi:MAG: ABC1 kinase family protein, partial [Microcoleaceae cyanobacterium]